MADEIPAVAPAQTAAPAQPAGTTPAATETPATPAVPAEPGAEVPAAAPAAKGDEDAPKGAPEAYAAFTLPEGYTMPDSRFEEVTAFAKANDWDQSKTQEAVDLYVKMQQEGEKVAHDTVTKQIEDWTKAIKEDAELGGADFDKKAGIAASAVDKFGSDELKQALSDTGMGSHPELVRMMYKVGLLLQEDTTPHGAPKGNPPASHAEVLYPPPSS